MADDVEKVSQPNIVPPKQLTPAMTASQTPSARSSPSAYNQGGGSYGMTPEMSGAMTFKEIGSLGLRAFSGWVREEFLPELIGRQGAQKYREMSDNNPIIGAIIYAIKATMRKVEWRVVPAGAEENKRTAPEAQEMADFVESCMHDMCYDDQTEILTEKRGWILFKNLDSGDRVAQRDVDGFMTFVKPRKHQVFNFDGELLGHRGDAVDFLVTPNHRMLFAPRRGRKHDSSQKINLGIHKCEDIFNRSGWVSKQVNWRGRQASFWRAPRWAELLGFFVADGHASDRQVYLIQKETAYVNQLLDDVGLLDRFHPRSVNGATQWILSDAAWARSLRSDFGETSRFKKLPQWLKELGPEDLRLFLRGFAAGDGWKSNSGLTALYTASRQLADDLQEIALKAGYIANVSSHIQKHGFAVGSTQYRVALWSNKKEYGLPYLKAGRGWYRQPYKGRVYCVSVPSGVVLVRRNGKPLWSGNSHSWEDLVDENLSMLTYGYAPHEICYKRRMGSDPGDDPDNPGEELPRSEYDDGRIGWRRIPIRGQDTILKWFFSVNGQIKGMTQLPWVGPMIDMPIEKLLLFRPSAHKNNPEGRSILRTSYLSYYFVKRLQEMEAIVGERLGGVPVLSVPGHIFDAANAGDPQATAALQNYKKIATNVRIDEQMGIVLPSDVWIGSNGAASGSKQFDFELKTPTGRPMGGFVFDTTIQRYSTYMMTSVMADFLALGHQSRGTQSLAISKVDMFFQAIEGYLNSMAAVYNRHGLPRLWKLNGFNSDAMPKIEPDLAQRVDLDVLSNFILRLSQAGMPLFPNEDLQTYILDAGGLPDVIDENALRAAGLLDEQLQVQDDKDQATLERMQQPPTPPTNGKGPQTPGRNPLEKMLLRDIARRMVKMQGPNKFGIHTHSHANGKIRKRRKANLPAEG